MWWAGHIADQIHRKIDPKGQEAWVTSTGESKHRVKRSRHYKGGWGWGYGNAFDLRIWYVRKAENGVQRFADHLSLALGEHYVVVTEKNHLHVHWAPVFEGE